MQVKCVLAYHANREEVELDIAAEEVETKLFEQEHCKSQLFK